MVLKISNLLIPYANAYTCQVLTHKISSWTLFLIHLFQSKASMQFEMKTLQQSLDKEISAHKSTMAQLDAKNRKYASIEGVKSEQMRST